MRLQRNAHKYPSTFHCGTGSVECSCWFGCYPGLLASDSGCFFKGLWSEEARGAGSSVPIQSLGACTMYANPYVPIWLHMYITHIYIYVYYIIIYIYICCTNFSNNHTYITYIHSWVSDLFYCGRIWFTHSNLLVLLLARELLSFLSTCVGAGEVARRFGKGQALQVT